MKRTLLVYSCNHTLQLKTSAAIGACSRAGAAIVEQAGTSDVAVARNAALTLACAALEAGEQDVVLMVDADMAFTLQQAQSIVDHVRKTGIAASGCYIVGGGEKARLAATPFNNGRWLTGLGFLAIPAAMLLKLREVSPKFECVEGELHEFTSSGPALSSEGKRIWITEDTRFTSRLGGVELLPMAIGHIKTAVGMPGDETTLARVIAEHTPPLKATA